VNTLSTTLESTTVDSQPHPPQPPQPPTSRVVRRVGLADRIALHVGLALITWSRRPSATGPSRATVIERLRREDHWKAMYHLNQTWR
jgi:hypothetical protein